MPTILESEYYSTLPNQVAPVDADFKLVNNIAVIYKWIVYTVICPAIDVFGIGTNIINIICFVKQGFKDPVNVSLLGLAVADIGSLITIIWTNICLNPEMAQADFDFEPLEVQYLTSGMPHATFARISSWITALITMERCLCIAMPLKVSSIITSKRVFIVIVFIYVICIASGAPVYVVNKLDMKFVPTRNRTIYGLVFTKDRDTIENISYIINNAFLPFCAFVIITVCTTILTLKLQAEAKWRNVSAKTEQAQIVSNRNQKVAKMVVMISTLFIVCFIPLCALFIVIAVNPDFFIDGKYMNIMLMVGGIGVLAESINSSVNIFIYYKMSSRYRRVFQEYICPSKAMLE